MVFCPTHNSEPKLLLNGLVAGYLDGSKDNLTVVKVTKYRYATVLGLSSLSVKYIRRGTAYYADNILVFA